MRTERQRLYIFLGDYTGKGTENARVIEFLISVLCRENVILLEGNDEKCLCSPAVGEAQTRISEFRDNLYSLLLHSLPELEQIGVTGKNVPELYRKTVPCVYYKFHNRHVLVTHGSLSNLPENLPVENGRTFNLCDESRNGGFLRVLTLDKEGFHARFIVYE